jgi:hypothetical protein
MQFGPQHVYTDAMTAAYRRQAMPQALEDEAERSALRLGSLTTAACGEVAQLLRLPQRGPFVVIAAKCPAIGKQPLPGVAAMLRSIDIFSAWRLLPDLQTGIAHVASDTERGALLDLLGRVATTAVGVSPEFDNLADTAQALRYARVAVNARGRGPGPVTVFDDSVIAVAAVSAPEVTTKVADLVLGAFDDMTSGERDVVRNVPDVGGQQRVNPDHGCAALLPSQHGARPAAPHRGTHRAVTLCAA